MSDVTEQKSLTENYANTIWAVADLLHGPFNDDEYGEVILPFVLLRRFECVLQPTRKAVLERSAQLTALKIFNEMQTTALCSITGVPFYNTSKFSLATLGQDHVRDNLIAYKDGFSKNVRDILDHFEFNRICARLEKADKLFPVVDFFQALDMNVHPRVMSNLYEELIWRFADTKHKASKEYLTPRDIVHLATTLVLDSDNTILTATSGLIRTCYDPTCGTCGFITDAMEFIREATHDNKLRTELQPYGQEINDVAWAMGKAMMLLTGCNADSTGSTSRDLSTHILQGDTLKTDCHLGKKFDFVFSNPPFGMDWKDAYDSVKTDSRFAVGLPPKSDGSMLFLTHVARKMAPAVYDAQGELERCGHGAIVLSGSPLFTGGAGSGSSEIRRWLLEEDLVEAIVQMPGELFYNTSIVSYLWILASGKPKNRRGKVLLIDATSFKTPIRNIGNKRYQISPEQITKIAEVFRDYKDGDFSKVLDYQELGYRAVTIQCPLKARLHLTTDTINAALDQPMVKGKLSDEDLETLRTILNEHTKETGVHWIDTFGQIAKGKGVKLTKAFLKTLFAPLTVKDSEGETVKDNKGNVVYDPDLKQVENIPLVESVDEYFEREVKPFLPDAVIDRTVTDPKEPFPTDDGGNAHPKTPGIVGYEINFNKYFYKYVPPRNPEEIAEEIKALEAETAKLMKELFE